MAKIKIPPTVKIGTHTYSVMFDRNIRTDDDHIGQVNHRTQEIKIWTEAPLSMRNESLLHELIHIAEYYFRVRIDDADIDRIAECMCDFLFNNLNIEFDWSCITENVDK